jgi:putative transposase
MNDTPIHHRRASPRLKKYDYSNPGGYFVTILTHDRVNLFADAISSNILGETVVNLTSCGKIAEFTWLDLPNHNPEIELDAFVIMPNHVHGIIIIKDMAVDEMEESVRAGSEPALTEHRRHSLSEIIRQFKTFSARRMNELRQTPGQPVWHRSYYDRIIRNQSELQRIRLYIEDNPRRWAEDEENPDGHLFP